MKTKHFEVNPVVVEWVDSTGIGGWNFHRNAEEDVSNHCISVGHLFRKDKDSIRICLNMSPHQKGDILVIPTVAIQRIRKLK